MSLSEKVNYWQPYILGSTPGNTIVRDHISVNFGEKKFKYKVPFGFVPMNYIGETSVYRNYLTFSTKNTLCLLLVTFLFS